MHAISYQMKRCHLSSVAIGRNIFRGTKPPEDPDYDGVPDMTPARFDILFLVRGRKIRGVRPPLSIGMADLRKKLGLARATISKAVKRLVELGLVTCDVASWSDREKVVALTEEGKARIQRAMHLVFTKRALTRHYQRFADFFARNQRQRRPWGLAAKLQEIHDDLADLARHHFDKSESIYEIRGEPECGVEVVNVKRWRRFGFRQRGRCTPSPTVVHVG